jgi:hypothetical protein
MNATLERPAALQAPLDEGDWQLPTECHVGEDR